MTLSVLLTVALLGPMAEDQAVLGPVAEAQNIDTCQAACDKVTDLTAGRWPKSRKGTEEQKQAFEEMRKKVHAQCMTDCEARGEAFITCVRRARKVQQISQCYQKAGS